MKINKNFLLVWLTAFLLAGCFIHKKQPMVPVLPIPSTKLPPGKAFPLHYTYSPNFSDSASYRVVSFADLPQWSQQSFVDSLKAFKISCQKLQNQSEWQQVCQQAKHTGYTNHQAQRFFELYFTPWQVRQNNRLDGITTGYYEPLILGDTQQTSQARFPIYGIPNDFIVVPFNTKQYQDTVRINITGQHTGIIADNGKYTANLAKFPINNKTKALKGRIANNQFIPYYTRAQINAGALNNKASILGYANDPVELFFLHIQGSGRLKTPTGKMIRLGFLDKNDYSYVSIGKYMAKKGYLPLEQTSMQGIKAWLQQHPEKLAEILGQNPSYIFFQSSTEPVNGPIGALGVPLTSGYSAAMDQHFIQLGAPVFLATTHPASGYGLNKLIMAQDTGSAINGPMRVDFFWGYGDEAGRLAGKMKYPGYIWQLLPRGILPIIKR